MRSVAPRHVHRAGSDVPGDIGCSRAGVAGKQIEENQVRAKRSKAVPLRYLGGFRMGPTRTLPPAQIRAVDSDMLEFLLEAPNHGLQSRRGHASHPR
jgi:hypothetical protein